MASFKNLEKLHNFDNKKKINIVSLKLFLLISENFIHVLLAPAAVGRYRGFLNDNFN